MKAPEGRKQGQMETQEQQIALLVRRIDEIKRSRDQHWSDAKRAVEIGNLDHAIKLLNAHFFQVEELSSLEAQLRGILKGYYADK